MRAELTAIIRQSEEGYVASCAEVPGTEIEAATEQEALESLMEAVSVIFEVNRNDALRELGAGARHCRISVDFEEFDESLLFDMEDEAVAFPS